MGWDPAEGNERMMGRVGEVSNAQAGFILSVSLTVHPAYYYPSENLEAKGVPVFEVSCFFTSLGSESLEQCTLAHHGRIPRLL